MKHVNLKSENQALIHDCGIDTDVSHIFLFGEESYIGNLDSDDVESGSEPGVEYSMANRLIKNLHICTHINPKKPIVIHMKTCGGAWAEGMAIYNAIKACPVPVTVLSYTHARSMSSLIFLAANKRVMMPDSYFMFHDGTESFSGTVRAFRSYAKFIQNACDRMVEIYTDALKEQGKFATWSRQRIERMIQHEMEKKEDVYLTDQETVQWGFADEIFDISDKRAWEKLTVYSPKQLARK